MTSRYVTGAATLAAIGYWWTEITYALWIGINLLTR